jgi:integral membrane protein
MLRLLQSFRIVALLEGISYILLLCIATPIKHFGDNPMFVKWLGMPHGMLFMLYIVMTLALVKYMKWNTKTTGIILLASVIPFGTFYVEKNI